MPKMSQKRRHHMKRMRQLIQLKRVGGLAAPADPGPDDKEQDDNQNENPEDVLPQGPEEPPRGKGKVAEEVQQVISESSDGEGRHMEGDSDDEDHEEGERAISVNQLKNMDKARVVSSMTTKLKRGTKKKAKAKPPPPPIRLRPRPPFPSPSFCFICVESTTSTSLGDNTGRPKVTEGDYLCMLGELLELPRTQSQHYLEQMGRPEMWIGLCDRCLSVIREAAQVREEITQLEARLKTCQQQIVGTMKATELNSFNGGRKVNPYGEGRREQRLAVENILRFVYSHKYFGGRGDTNKGRNAQIKKILQRLSASATKKIARSSPSPSPAKEIKSRVSISSIATSVVQPQASSSRSSNPGTARQLIKPRILQKAKCRLPDGAVKEEHLTGALLGHARGLLKPISVQQLPASSTFIPVEAVPIVDDNTATNEDLSKDPLSLLDNDHIEDKLKPKVVQKNKPLSSATSPRPAPVPASAKSQLVHYYGCDECQEDDTIYTSKYQLELHKYNVHWKSRHVKPKGEKVVTVVTPTPAPVKKDVVTESESNASSSEGESKEEYEVIKKTEYDCPNCPEVVNFDVRRYADHLLLHQDNPYKCSGCGELLPADEALRERHWKAEHPSVVLPSLSEPDSAQLPVKFRKLNPDPGNIWKCDGCFSGFLTEDAREYHERTCSILRKRAKTEQGSSSALLDPTYICPICKFSSRNIEEWRLHRVIHHPEVDRLSCLYCDESFTKKSPGGREVVDEDQMRNHLKKGHQRTVVRRASNPPGNKPSRGSKAPALTLSQLEEVAQLVRYDCTTCPAVTDYDINRFAQHLTIHQRNPYKCTICSAFLPPNEDAQDEHWREEHSTIEFPSASTTDQPPEKFTRVTLDPGEIWKCDGCFSGFASNDARNSHERSCLTLLRNPKPRLGPSSASSSPPKYYACSTCPTSFRNMNEWRLHRVLKHPEVDLLACLFCEESFAEKTVEGVEVRDNDKMTEHITRMAKAELTSKVKIHARTGCRVYDECDRCGLVFKSSSDTKTHFKNIHGTPDGGHIYTCPVCLMGFASKPNLRHHLNKRHFRKEHSICDICGASYLQQSSMAEHKLTKHGVVPEGRKLWSCPVDGCQFGTVFKSSLDVHAQNEHGAPRKHACKHCGKMFLKVEHKRKHEQSHENKLNKPFQCEICGNSFALRNHLYIHKRLSHEGRTFPSTNKKKGPPTGTKPRLAAISVTQEEADNDVQLV